MRAIKKKKMGAETDVIHRKTVLQVDQRKAVVIRPFLIILVGLA